MAKVCDFSVARVIDGKGGLLTGYVGKWLRGEN